MRNSSVFPIHYEWNLSTNCHKRGGAEDRLVTISPTNGIVSAHNKANNDLIFSPCSGSALKNCELILQVYLLLILSTHYYCIVGV